MFRWVLWLTLFLLVGCDASSEAPLTAVPTEQPTVQNTPPAERATSTMTTSNQTDATSAEQAFILEVKNSAGVRTEEIEADVSAFVSADNDAELSATSGTVLEDLATGQELLLLFSAAELLQLDGFLTFALRPVDSNSALRVRAAMLTSSEDSVLVRAELRGDTRVSVEWGYTRMPITRQVALPLEGDPFFLIEAKQFHQARLSEQNSLEETVEVADEWESFTFSLPAFLLEQVRRVDLCEQLIEQVDEQFSAGEFLTWDGSSFSMQELEQVVAEAEMRLLSGDGSFNITLDIGGEQFVVNKRIQPLIRHALRFVAADEAVSAGQIGCSLNLPS